MMETVKILVVEDETIIAMDIRNSLKKMGYSVPAIASSGEAALQKIAEFQPHLVLMDIMLRGDIDGVETAEKIRQLYQIPIIFLTAHSDLVTLTRAKATEPFGYVVKPFEERDLQTTIEIALARAKAEAEVRKSLEKERELNELKTLFISIVSHEFRTPLSTILFSASLLENYGNQWSEERRITHLQRIQGAVHHMTQLLEDILILGKYESGTIVCHPHPLNLQEFCQDIIEEFQLTIGSQHKLFFEVTQGCSVKAGTQSTTCLETLPVPEVYLDEKLLRQILTNLLSNAIKYSELGSKVNLELIYLDQQVCFKIHDQGLGIPSEAYQHLFEKFYRASNVGNIPGTGLGLAIVKRSVDLHRGKITVESQLEQGTTFTVWLPSQLASFA